MLFLHYLSAEYRWTVCRELLDIISPLMPFENFVTLILCNKPICYFYQQLIPLLTIYSVFNFAFHTLFYTYFCLLLNSLLCCFGYIFCKIFDPYIYTADNFIKTTKYFKRKNVFQISFKSYTFHNFKLNDTQIVQVKPC